jgi:hypothetical protein
MRTRRALVTAAGHREVALLELEGEVGAEPAAKRREGSIRDLDDVPTAFADEVVMGVVDEVVHGRPVPEVDVVDDAETLELVEEAVDGGFVHVGLAGLDVGGQLFGGGMAIMVDERLQDRPPGTGDPPAVGSEKREHLVESVCGCHRASSLLPAA